MLLKKNGKRQYSNYEPYEHRHVPHATNFCETVLHLLKASVGTGVLAMPYAFHQAGYLAGTILTVTVGLLCMYCMRTLVVTQYELCRRNELPSMTYPTTSQMSIKDGPHCCRNFKYMALLTNIMILGFQIGASCIYHIFVAQNIRSVVQHYMDNEMDVRIYLLINMIPVILFSTINNLHILAILSLTANCFTIIGFIIIGYFIFRDMPTSLENRVAIGNPKNYPQFLGIIVFSMEAIGAVMVLENNMANPKRYTSCCGVLTVSLVPTVLIYISLGLFGYLKYGSAVQGSITLNLPKTEILSQICILLFVYGIFCTNILAIFIAFEMIWQQYIEVLPGYEAENETWKIWSYQFGLRVALQTITMILALIVPSLELVISFIGSLTLASSGIAFIGLIAWYTYWEDYDGINFALLSATYIMIIIIGCIILIIGVYISILDVIAMYSNN